MNTITDTVAKIVVAQLITEKALELMGAQDVAKAYLNKLGRSESDADQMVAEVLNDIADRYRKEITDKGIKPNVQVEIIKMPQR